MAQLRIQTTQNVSISYETASVGERIAAYLLDGVVQVGWVVLGILLAAAMRSAVGTAGDTGIIVLVCVIGLPIFAYHLVSEALWNGQSIGKRLMKLRVVSLNGAPPRFSQYLLRWVLRLVDINLFSGIIAIVTIASSGRGQRVGDIAAGTAVVRTTPRETLDTGLFGTEVPEEEYRVRFPQVTALSDHDIRLLQELLSHCEQRGSYFPLIAAAQRVRELTGIQTTMADYEFLLVVLRDYAHLATQGAER
ncbi:RDD family protein [Hymenobacter sp. CRA2]|uniref:RDD family protein n=1 Tax=Hymenobacter sp. CRA2 TaxID=1955620 RepID=UPI0009CAB59D|nr:RDD family protein [Hymenobacter sp. CRA2]OON69858.1 hypothetical protein B0919_07395 [Hymenobacter sp. CRA2]